MRVAERPLDPCKEALVLIFFFLWGEMGGRQQPDGLRVRTWVSFDLGNYLVSSMGDLSNGREIPASL